MFIAFLQLAQFETVRLQPVHGDAPGFENPVTVVDPA
jgi:hypothetical protein